MDGSGLWAVPSGFALFATKDGPQSVLFMVVWIYCNRLWDQVNFILARVLECSEFINHLFSTAASQKEG